MRILLINSEYPPVGGGASNATAYLSQAFIRAGHDIVVLTTRFADLPLDSFDGEVRVIRCRARRRERDRSNAFEQVRFMFLAVPAILRLARHWRPDASIAFFGIPSGPAAWMLRLFHRVPFIVSLRGGDVPGFRPEDFRLYHRLAAPLIRFIWRRADAVVANSDGLRRLAASFDGAVSIEVIPNGVALEEFDQSKRNWTAARILIVGRLAYQKGIDLLLQSLVELKELAWTLSIVGDGPEKPELERMVDILELKERVTFQGWMDKASVHAQLAQATLFAYPSRDEGMPNAVLEAMAAGLPVIATHIAGNEELILHGKNGLLVPKDDSNALRDALRELIPDAQQRARMGAASRAIVEGKYSWQRTALEYLELIEKIKETA
jgi:glycosyltransferase involved in cell wall biosynthesis